jgi:hypothetical protein
MGTIIKEKVKALEKKLGFNFKEMGELAEKSPEEFERRKKEIFQREFPGVSEEKIDEFLSRVKGNSQDPIDSVVGNLVDVCRGIQKQNEFSSQCVEKLVSYIPTDEYWRDLVQGLDFFMKKVNEILVKQAWQEAQKIPKHNKN